ncbi:hypothetical protein ACHAP4_008339 [Fusarium culmorum]
MATLRQEFENEAKRLRKVKSEARDAPEEASLDHAKISDMGDTQLSISTLLRQQRQQALDTLNRIEPQQKQMELSREKEMEDLKRENQRLYSENQALQHQIDCSRSESAKVTTAVAPQSAVPTAMTQTASNLMSREFEQIAKYALEFDITGVTTSEIGVLCQVLHTKPCRDNLKRFMQAQVYVATTHPQCLRKIGNGSMGASLLARPAEVKCPWCQRFRFNCVWIVRKMGQWIVGSGTPT